MVTAAAASLLTGAGLAAPAAATSQPPDLFPITPPTDTSVSGMEGVAYSRIVVEYDGCERAGGRDLAFTLRSIPGGGEPAVLEPDGSSVRLSGPAVSEGSSLEYTVFGGTYRFGATAVGDDGAFAGVDITIPIDSEDTVRTSELCGSVGVPPAGATEAPAAARTVARPAGAAAGTGPDAAGKVRVPTRIETGVAPAADGGSAAAALGLAALLVVAAGSAIARHRRHGEQ